jgi:hypothetical protein
MPGSRPVRSNVVVVLPFRERSAVRRMAVEPRMAPGAMTALEFPPVIEPTTPEPPSVPPARTIGLAGCEPLTKSAPPRIRVTAV